MAENILFDTKILNSEFEFNTSEVIVPELNKLMDIKEGSVVFKVRQATLDEVFRARMENDATLRIADLSSKLTDALINKNDKEASESLIEAYTNSEKPSQETSMRLFICEKCVIEPKLSHTDVVKLAKFYPAVITRIVDEVYKLTDIGGVKKNS